MSRADRRELWTHRHGAVAYRPAPSNTLEDYRNRHEFLHSISGTHYSMLERDGAYYQRRWQTGFDGRETNVEEVRIDAVIGSGNHARSYLHRTTSGGYIELPLGWYAERRWLLGDEPRLQCRAAAHAAVCLVPMRVLS